jgi:hypothetical protein
MNRRQHRDDDGEQVVQTVSLSHRSTVVVAVA